MNKKILLIIHLVLIFILSINIVKAEDSQKELYKQFSTPEVSTYYNLFKKIKTAFFKNGVVTYNRNTIDSDNLIYYDFNGKMIASITVEDLSSEENFYIMYMEEHDNYLYLLTNKGLYKLNDKLEKVASNNEIIIDFDGIAWARMEYGLKQMEFANEGIYLSNKYFVDYDLENVTIINDAEKYKYILEPSYYDNEDYWESDELRSACGYEAFNERYFSCDKRNENIILSSDNVHLELYKNDERQWSIRNEDYDIFIHTKFYNDIIITIAGKYDKNVLNYKSDILFYDLEGNYLGKIEENEMLSSLIVSEEKFAFGKQIVDGICTEDKYSSSDSGCDSITTFDVYALGTSKVNSPEDGNSSDVTTTNPETSSSKIMYIFTILLGSLSIGLLIRKKIKL